MRAGVAGTLTGRKGASPGYYTQQAAQGLTTTRPE
jgi:hypothetical protein